MASKKLSVELELETAKAKKDLEGMADSVDSPSSSRITPETGSAAKAAGEIERITSDFAERLREVSNVFGDLANKMSKTPVVPNVDAPASAPKKASTPPSPSDSRQADQAANETAKAAEKIAEGSEKMAEQIDKAASGLEDLANKMSKTPVVPNVDAPASAPKKDSTPPDMSGLTDAVEDHQRKLDKCSDAADKTAEAMKRAAGNAKQLGDSSEKAGVNMKQAVKSFSGLAAGMAMSYAARSLPQGSTARTAVEYGAGAIQGASMGMMFGPWGAALGAAAGMGKVYFDKKSDKETNIKEWKRSERDYKDNKAWVDFMKSVNNLTEEKKSYAERISEAKDMLDVYKDAEDSIKKEVEALLELGKTEEANRKIGNLAQNRSRQQTLNDSIFSMEEASKNDGQRASFAALDDISRVGGNMFGEGGSGDEVLRVEREQVEILKSIDRKTGGGLVWQ